MSETQKNFEVTFIVDPVLSGDEIKATAQTYLDHLESEGCKIIHLEKMGLRQLAYPINRRTSGVYYCIEFESPDGEVIPKVELALRRDERIMRFLAVKLDKFGVKYNDDKRKGLIGKKSKKQDEKSSQESGGGRGRGAKSAPAKSAPVKSAAPAKAAETQAPKAEPKKEEEE